MSEEQPNGGETTVCQDKNPSCANPNDIPGAFPRSHTDLTHGSHCNKAAKSSRCLIM
jgi:hypothetical protein